MSNNDELQKALDFITRYVYTHSMCRLDAKEKWGTLRYTCVYPPAWDGYGPVISLPYPLFYKLGEDGEKYRIYLIYWTDSFIYRMWSKRGWRALRKGILKACKKYPNVAKELTKDLNWRD